ncbi:MAG TPA: MBL fold metallo-hydrolase [Patescibacteria group bacterium]|nr:MBL fold metallo-hydrolase [Patescibacteria group bacterium]
MSRSNKDEDLIVPKKWYDVLPRKSWERFKKVETNHPWFEVYEVKPGVYALYEPGQFQEVISYLVLGEEKAALIDTGYGMGNIKGLVEELTDLPIKVVITHTHVDHIGQNSEFDDVSVFDHPFARENATKDRPAGSMKGSLGEGMVWKPLPEGLTPESYKIPPFKVTRWLKDGDTIKLGGKTLEVYHTPGHSPDSICILDRADRLFWTGDIFYNAPLYVYGPTTDLDNFIESYRKMVSLYSHYDWLMPSHNETYVDKEILERVLKAAEDIRAGKGGEYREQNRRGLVIRRYDREGFAIIVKAQ